MGVVQKKTPGSTKVGGGQGNGRRTRKWLDKTFRLWWDASNDLLRKLTLASLVWKRLWNASHSTHMLE